LDLDTLKVKDEQTKEYKRLSEFEEVMIAVFISYNDCQTCIEAIMQDILRYKSGLKLKKENIALIVAGGSDEFLKFVKYRFAKYFDLFTLEVKIKTPLIFFIKLKKYVLIEPSVESILYFSQMVDSLIFNQIKK